ncbi:hemophore [Mycobacterium sp.]|uniref:hemophore n=1 Tax=Mycobacterium sp. TaxID=1785 RepID=UPI003D0B8864
MRSLTASAAARRRLLAALTATGLGGATAVVLLSAPSAVGASDPCAASEMARTISNVARSAGDYLDGHPETNQAMTSVMQQPPGPTSVSSLETYFDANPKAASDMQTIASPLAGLSSRCKISVSLPQVLGFMQSAQGAMPGGAAAAMPGGVISGAQNTMPGGAGAAAAVPGTTAAVPGLSAVR